MNGTNTKHQKTSGDRIMFKQLGFAAIFIAAFIPSVLGDTLVTFNYQGRVKVMGSDYQGTGNFKFAILNTSATATLWSNDGTASGEPASSVALQVDTGVFSVLIGDPSLGM